MSSFLQTYGKEFVSVLVPIILWALNYVFRARAKLHLSMPHAFKFLVQEPLRDEDGNEISPTQSAHTRSFLVSNSGRATATKIEIVFNWKPLCLNVWPPRHFEEIQEADGRYTLTFESLAPNEYLGLHVLTVNNELPNLVSARCDQCVAENVDMYPQPHVPTWKRRVAVFLLFAGIAAVVYGLIILLQFVILKTPYGYWDSVTV